MASAACRCRTLAMSSQTPDLKPRFRDVLTGNCQAGYSLSSGRGLVRESSIHGVDGGIDGIELVEEFEIFGFLGTRLEDGGWQRAESQALLGGVEAGDATG